MPHPSHQPVDRPGRVFPYKRADYSQTFAAALALLRTMRAESAPRPCQMEAYFNTMKDAAFGGPRVVSLVCTCPRCAGRCTL